MAKITFTTPSGRLVAGSLTKPNDKDAEGRPLVHKSGPDMGKPRTDFFFALAIPKDGKPWQQTDWGRKIYEAGCAFLPHAPQLPTFAWKVRDGDSTVPNKRGNRPCDQEGWAGNWVVMYSSGFAPRCYTIIGSATPTACDGSAINLGDFVQVYGTVDGNGSTSQPGVYLNHSMICQTGYGPRIIIGPDASSVGFGGPLPVGASATPPGGFVAPVMPVAPAPVMPVAPNPAFLLPPVPVRRMSPAANGATYEQMLSVGWTHEMMQQHGMLAAD